MKPTPAKRKAHLMNLKRNRGFTLIEMIITVAVMAILVATTTPSIYEFIRQRDKQNEEIAQMQVRKALEAYIADNGIAPDDGILTGNNAWFNKLAGYTNLSAKEIADDVWGMPRTYIAYLDTSRNLYGTPVSVTYVTLHSMGEDGQADNQDETSSTKVLGIPINTVSGRSTYKGSSDGGWWKYQTDKIGTFAKLRGADDDIMMRYTNYEDVLARYNATQERLDKLSEALETYARSQYANHVSLCAPVKVANAICNADGTPKNVIYYPRSTPVENTNTKKDKAAYMKDGALNPAVVVDNTKNEDDRRTGMKNLMALLGLPLEYCCSALETDADGDPRPFYYFSNPRPRDAGKCGDRKTTDEAKLPARLTTDNFADTNIQRTCG